MFGFGEVAVIKIEGPIFDSIPVLKELRFYQENDAVKALVLRIDSPGGAVAPSQEIFEEVKKFKKDKIVVVSMGTLAASGGYYIASAAHKIVASPGTVTGSIGVIMETMGVGEVLKTLKLESRVIKSGEYKDIGSPLRGVEPKEKAYLQAMLDNMYHQFVEAVSEQRKIPLETMKGLAEGKIYTGQQALEVGLVDQLGTLYDAIDEAKKMAHLSEDAGVIWPREERFPWGPFRSFLQLGKVFKWFGWVTEQGFFPLSLYMIKG